MDQAEKDRLRALIRTKRDELNGKLGDYQAKRTPEIDAEFQRKIDKIASKLVVTQTGQNEYQMTAKGMSLPTRLPLTKTALMRLPEGCWIVSGVSHNDGTPILTTRVGDLDSRAELWALMRARAVVGRNFTVLLDKAALDAHLKEWERIRAQAEERRGASTSA